MVLLWERHPIKYFIVTVNHKKKFRPEGQRDEVIFKRQLSYLKEMRNVGLG